MYQSSVGLETGVQVAVGRGSSPTVFNPLISGAALQGSEWSKHETGHPFKTNAKVKNANSFIRVFSTHTHTHTSTTRCFEKRRFCHYFQGWNRKYVYTQNINYLEAFKSLFHKNRVQYRKEFYITRRKTSKSVLVH
jgi:hypothetical protein